MMIDKSSFVNGYSQLVIRAWSSEEYLDFVRSSPKLALADVGIGVPEDATVQVSVVEATENGKIEDQVARWEDGYATGLFHLVIAERPEDFDPADMAINDEALAGLAGGAEGNTKDNGGGDTGDGSIGIYCCCTPCCCCG